MGFGRFSPVRSSERDSIEACGQYNQDSYDGAMYAAPNMFLGVLSLWEISRRASSKGLTFSEGMYAYLPTTQMDSHHGLLHRGCPVRTSKFIASGFYVAEQSGAATKTIVWYNTNGIRTGYIVRHEYSLPKRGTRHKRHDSFCRFYRAFPLYPPPSTSAALFLAARQNKTCHTRNAQRALT